MSIAFITSDWQFIALLLIPILLLLLTFCITQLKRDLAHKHLLRPGSKQAQASRAQRNIS